MNETTNDALTAKKPVVFIIPPTDLSDTNVYPSSHIYREMLFKSIYNFIAPLPYFEEKLSTKASLSNPQTSGYNADITINGSYLLEGNKNNPVIKISVSIQSVSNKPYLFQKNYATSSGMEIFDTIDDIITDLAVEITKLKNKKNESLPPAKLAHIVFSDFKINKEEYEIYLNNKLLETVRDNTFALKLDIMPDETYQADIIHKDDRRKVLRKDFSLSPDETAFIDYEAKGNIIIKPLKNREQWKSYKYLVDGEQVETDSIISNVPSSLETILTIEDNRSNIVFSESFTVKDGEVKILNPKLNWKGGLHLMIYKTDDTYAGFGLEYFISRYLSVRAGCSFNSFYDNGSLKTLFALYPRVEIFYFLLGDLLYHFRAGAGLTYQFTGIFSETTDYANQLNTGYSGIGIFGSVEYLVFMIKPSIFYNFYQLNPQIEIGIRF